MIGVFLSNVTYLFCSLGFFERNQWNKPSSPRRYTYERQQTSIGFPRLLSRYFVLFFKLFFFLVVISHSTSSHRPCTRLIIVSYFHRMLSAFGIWVLFNKTLRWWGEALTTRISPLWKSFITSHFDWRSALSWMRKLRDIITSFRQRRTYKVWEGRALGQRDKRDKELIEICSFGFYFVRAIWEPRERVVNCVNNRRFVSLFAIHDIYNLSNSQGRRLPLTKRYDWFALKMENEDFLICSQ